MTDPVPSKELDVQPVMWLVFEYARIMDGSDALVGDERAKRVAQAYQKDAEIRAAIRSLMQSAQSPLGERSVAEITAAVDERLDRVERELARSKDLLPCPFCGGVARWCKDDEHECHLVVCSDCKISIDFQENPDTETVQELRDIMAEKWNRRASQPPGDGQ